MIHNRIASSRMISWVQVAFTAVLFIVLALGVSAQSASQTGGAPEDSSAVGFFGPDNLWRGWFGLEGKFGTDRSLGEAELFVPVSQDDESLFLRTSADGATTTPIRR